MGSATSASKAPATSVLRPLIMHGLLFVLLMLFPAGLSTLLTALFNGFDGERVSAQQLAVAYSYTLVAGPLAWLLWRAIRRKLARPCAADSAIWSLQASGVYLVSLIAASCSVLGLLAGLVNRAPEGAWQSSLGTALGWGALCAWQHRQLASPKTAPQQLGQLAGTLGNAFSMLLFALSLVWALRVALLIMIRPDTTLAGPSDLDRLLAAVIWLAGSAALWFWHWKLRRVQEQADGFSSLAFVVLAIAAPAAACLLATAALVSWALPLPWDPAAQAEEFRAEVPMQGAIMLAAGLIWLYHQLQLRSGMHVAATVSAARLAVSGISLALLATGLGMVVNALLASISALPGINASAEVLGEGLGLLLVGAICWFAVFRPLQPAWPASRGAYLVLFFGASSVVALVALLVLGYRIFAYFLEPGTGYGTLLDAVRGPLGWLVATAAVAAYHYALWRSGRSQRAESAAQDPARSHATPQLRTLVLLAPAGSERLFAQLRALGDLKVQWIRTAGPALDDEADAAVFARINERLATEPSSFLAIAGPDGAVQFTELA